MIEKHDHPITVKLTESQARALRVESRMTGNSEVDLIRSFIDSLSEKQVQAYRLLSEIYKGEGNLENFDSGENLQRGFNEH